MSEPDKAQAERPVTPQLEVPQKNKSSSRQASPVRLPSDLVIKVHTQWGRIATLNQIAESIPTTHEETSLDELSQLSALLDETHKAFVKEHAYFEVTWPSALISHEYFSKNAHSEESMVYLTARRAISKLRNSLTAAAPQQSSATPPKDASRVHSRLPDITLPKFSGDYALWPAFRDLFSSMILTNQQLNDVDKLHYLRVSLEGSAAQLISGLPMSGDSLTPSWEALTDRYENPRLLIHSYLERLFASSGPIPRKAASLNRFLTNVNESLSALESMGVKDELGDSIIVYHVTKQLDRVTREQWETSIGDTREYPRFEQLKTFLTSRVRALESMESPSSSLNTSVASTASKKAVSHHASQTKAATNLASTTHPCDGCGGQHYIVVCTQFKDLTPLDRQKLVIAKRLCFNCLGRHSVRSCKSRTVCKKCARKHHTMLHEANITASSLPDASSSSQPSN